MNELSGVYAGIVENVSDPEKLGRVKARVPHVHGINGGISGFVPTDAIAWALPYGMPAGVSGESGGLSWLPQISDQVLVQFLDGEPEQPVWTWFMQTRAAAAKLKLHHYDTKAKGDVGTPDRAILSRYGHSLEMKPDKVTLTTKQGYQILLEESTAQSGGTLKLITPKGQSVRLDDLNEDIVVQGLESVVVSAKRVILNAPTSGLIKTTSFTLMAGSSMINVDGNSILISTGTGATVVVDGNGNIAISSASGATLSLENNVVQLGEPTTGTGVVIEPNKMSVNASQVVVNTAAFSIGTTLGYPVLIMSPAALAWFLGHTHESTTPGSPTTPPILPFPEEAGVSTRLFTS